MDSYRVDCRESRTIITHMHSGYSLAFFPEADMDCFTRVRFSAPYYGDRRMSITGRDMKDYPSHVRDMHVDPFSLYAEVGSGLGGLVDHLIEHGASMVTVIDMADYGTILRLSDYAVSHRIIQDGRLDLMASRAERILSSSRVRLFNMPLGTALAMHPELAQSQDVVIENWGPTTYPMTEGLEDCQKQEVFELERRLLKPQGRIVAYSGVLFQYSSPTLP